MRRIAVADGLGKRQAVEDAVPLCHGNTALLLCQCRTNASASA